MQRHARFALFEPDLDAVRGVRVHHRAVALPNAADGGQAVGVQRAARDEPGLGDVAVVGRVRQVERAVVAQPAPELAHPRAVAADQVVHVALEVGGLGDVHRRARGGLDLFRLARAVAPAAEELVQHVVLVARQDQAPDRQPHRARHVAGVDVAEIARGHRERDLLGVRRGGGEVALEVVHHLRRDARPVDRVDRADAVAALELGVGGDRLDDVLAVVEHALEREVVDVVVLQAVHLRRLERAHAPARREHEHAQALLAAHRVLGRRAGVARGGAEDVEPLAALLEHELEQVAEQLQREVLERERRPVRQAEDMQPRLERLERRDLVAAENRAGVGLENYFS